MLPRRAFAKMDVHMREIVDGASAALLLKVAGALFTFLMNVMAGRLLGVDGAGLFFLALAVVTIAAVLGRGGLDKTLLRFTATHASAGEWGLVKGVARLGVRLAVVALFAVALAVFLAAPILATHVFDDAGLTTPLRLMAVAIVPLGLVQLLAQMLRGLKRIAHSVLVQSVWLPALTVLGFFLLVPRLGVSGAAYSYVAAATLTLAIGGVLWLSSTREGPDAVPYDRGVFRSSSRPLYVVAVMQLFVLWGTTVVLGVFQPSAEVALFNAANRTAVLLTFVLLAVNAIAAPKFAALHRAGDVESLRKVVRGSAKLMAVVTFPGLLVLLLFPAKVLSIFGPEFSMGWPALLILAVGQYINVVTGSVALLLIMTGHEVVVRNVHVVACALTIGLAVALCPPLGATGAAIATATGLTVKNLAATALVRWRMGFWSISIWPSARRARLSDTVG